jgi:hypothetical protein
MDNSNLRLMLQIARLPPYRLVTLNKTTAPPRVIHCVDDIMAIQVARHFLDGHAIEIWHEAAAGRPAGAEVEGALTGFRLRPALRQSGTVRPDPAFARQAERIAILGLS